MEGNARARDGAEAPRALVTGGAGLQARACAGLGATGRDWARLSAPPRTPGQVLLSNSLRRVPYTLCLAHPAEPIPSLGGSQLSVTPSTLSKCSVRF